MQPCEEDPTPLQKKLDEQPGCKSAEGRIFVVCLQRLQNLLMESLGPDGNRRL